MVQDRYTAWYKSGRVGNWHSDQNALDAEGIEYEAADAEDTDAQHDEGAYLVFPNEEEAQRAADLVIVVDEEEDEVLDGAQGLRAGPF